MRTLFILIISLFGFCAELSAQNFSKYTVQNVHSHNDYKQSIPFWQAYHHGLGSIEVDLFIQDGKLVVAHERSEIQPDRSFEDLYLKPIAQQIKLNRGHIYKDADKRLMLLIEAKDPYQKIIPALVEELKKYPSITNNAGISLCLTGNLPEPKDFKNYPQYLFFDGDLNKSYTADELKRVYMFSSNLAAFTQWGGKGIPRTEDAVKLRSAIEKAHQYGKPIRFWGAPDFLNCWINLMDLDVDIINTDHIPQIAEFVNRLPKHFYKNTSEFFSYTPTYKSDNVNKRVKNIILLIPDGVTLPQYYAAYTANKGNVNTFKIKSTGYSNTNSANAYVTDSAPGSTAFATGVKTNNNYVGVDAAGKRLDQLPDILFSKAKVSGLISTGDITDATPADFYAHTNNRDDSNAVLRDFLSSKVKLLIGGPTSGLNEDNKAKFNSANIKIYSSLNEADFKADRLIVADPLASKYFSDGRGHWLAKAFDKSIERLSKDENGFFLMVEASRTDIAAHAKDLPNMVAELLDFDEVVGKALKFADSNGETLVVVVGDHETGGLTLVDGNISEAWVLGNYISNDHTAIPASVFAYGPKSGIFTGFYENTEIFNKILQALE